MSPKEPRSPAFEESRNRDRLVLDPMVSNTIHNPYVHQKIIT